MKISKAILRSPGQEIVNAISAEPHPPICFSTVKSQYENYVRTLEKMGISPTICEPDPQFPDGCFTEDTHLILSEILIRLNPGATSRANEYTSLQKALPLDRPHQTIPVELKIDGGDILVANKRIYVGLSSRTMPTAIDKLKQIVKPFDYEVIEFPVPDGLHLKSGMTCLNADVFIIQKSFEKIFNELHASLNETKKYFVVPDDEAFAANVLTWNKQIMIPPNCPKTKTFVAEYFLAEHIHEVDTSELRKVDGALTCLSIPYHIN